jgi:hypothetical protein
LNPEAGALVLAGLPARVFEEETGLKNDQFSGEHGLTLVLYSPVIHESIDCSRFIDDKRLHVNPLLMNGRCMPVFCDAALQQPRHFNVTAGSAQRKLKATQ